MKISLKWLQDFVDIADFRHKPEALADLLTKAGLEVEDIVDRSKNFQFVVTGLILSKEKHPNADKLSLCQVTTGEGVVHQIVCGAQNHKANDKVVVALPGAVLPGDFVIKNSVIRGVESGGMLCSEKELGLAKESQGLLILPEEAPLGISFAEYAGFDDVNFELKVTPNRADCLSHFGLAREVACLLGRPLKKVMPVYKVSENSTKKEVAVEVADPILCPRYAGRYVAGVKVGPSPKWLQQRLESIGLNSINNVVDVTNYVMMELGQPLHAFDATQIKGRKIKVEKARAGEKFETLDGTILTLSGEELMIKDAERAVALAGVVGGKNSGVSGQTTDVFIESAYFDPSSVRKTSRYHGLNTDSGYRFSRGVDPDGILRALDRTAELLLRVTTTAVAFADPYDLYLQPMKKAIIPLALQTVSDRLGYVAEAGLFESYMTRLGCQVEKTEGDNYRILPPLFRFDLESAMDLVEEYARLHGYEHIPETMPKFSATPTSHDPSFLLSYKVSGVLKGQGYRQALNLAFVGEKHELEYVQNFSNLSTAGLTASQKPIRLLNPLSDDLNVMRSTLSFGLFKNMVYNVHQGNSFGRLFEMGKTFTFKEEGSYQESWRLSLIGWGLEQDLWHQGQHPVVFELKSAVEGLLRGFGIAAYQWLSLPERGDVASFLHRGQNAVLQVEGKKVGHLGAFHPVLLDENKIRFPAAVAELDLEALFRGQPRGTSFESISKFPVIERDLALVMAKTVRAGDVQREILKLGGATLRSAEIFDLYEGEKLEKGQKSVAYRLRFQDRNATLQDEVVNQTIQTVLKGLIDKFSLAVR